MGPCFNAPSATSKGHGCGHIWTEKLKRVWLSTQVSHRGKYSIERLLALQEYTQNTSWTRVLLVCIGTPLPVILLVLLQDSIPLQDPSEGWSANYGFWIRAAVVAVVVGHTLIIQLKYVVESVTISSRQLGLVLVGVLLGHLAQCFSIAAKIAFPIPFMTIVTTPTYFLLLVGIFRLAVGRQEVREILKHQQQVVRFLAFLSAQTLMTIIYPAYQVLFESAAESGYELMILALLPVLKLFMKNVIAVSFTRMHDMMPEAVIFSVDFFNALYMVTSMQNASSTTTVAVIMATDVFNTMLALRGLQKSTTRTMGQLRRTKCSDGAQFNLLEAASSLCWRAREFELQDRSQIQLRSCIPYRVMSSASRDLLDRLGKSQGFQPHTRSFSHGPGLLFVPAGATTPVQRSKWRCVAGQRNSAVLPIVVRNAIQSKKAKTFTSTENRDEVDSLVRQSSLLQDTLAILFTTECHLLSEYLESIVPILYATFIRVMVYLPSARYHSEMAAITRENIDGKVLAVFAYALLEFLSFVVLVAITRRNCGMRPLHHLAFVLETHMPLIQGKLIAWTLLTLASRVVHFGMDFTFQFAWI